MPAAPPSMANLRPVEVQTPVGIRGVPVYPGDVIHGDGDNITVIPARFALEMAELCEKRDDIEAYLALRVQAGEPLWGLYPPGEATRAQHRAWVAAGRPERTTRPPARSMLPPPCLSGAKASVQVRSGWLPSPKRVHVRDNQASP